MGIKHRNLHQQLLPKRKERVLDKRRGRIVMLKIQSIAIELADARRGNHHAMRILECQNVQRSVHSIAEGLYASSVIQ